MSDMASRWAAAKVGPASVRDGKRVCAVYVECDGDPRAEVLALIKQSSYRSVRVDEPVEYADPKRRRAKKGGGE